MEHVRYLVHHEKTNPRIMDVDEGQEIQTKGTDKLSNRILILL
jgi:hypothetical protein